MPEFKEVLTRLMDERQLNDEDVGNAISIPPRTVAAWRRGERPAPKHANLVKLSRYFRVSTEHLTGVEESKSGKYEAMQVKYLSDAISTMKDVRRRLEKHRDKHQAAIDELSDDLAKMEAFLVRFDTKDAENEEYDDEKLTDRG